MLLKLRLLRELNMVSGGAESIAAGPDPLDSLPPIVYCGGRTPPIHATFGDWPGIRCGCCDVEIRPPPSRITCHQRPRLRGGRGCVTY